MRKYTYAREVCPFCGARIAERKGLIRGKWLAFVVISVLGVANVYAARKRETGPPPELEALHSSEEAIRQCREGIESRISNRDGTVQGSLEAEYLQGGEYVVRGAVSLVEGGRRVTWAALCEAQFRPESGWLIENVEVGS
jgi:hypothetical protein